MSDASGPQTVTVRCEKHGLRYNPNLHSGCVRCRKEAGELIGPASPAARAPAARGPAAGVQAKAAAGETVIPALALAAFLVVATGAGFYFAHRQWYETVGSIRSMNEEETFFGEEDLTPEQREQLERWREEMAKGTREGADR